MWYKNYYTWFLTGGFAVAAMVLPVVSEFESLKLFYSI